MTDFNLAPLKQAYSRFCEAIVAITDDIHRDGAIRRFEYTFELSWKTLKRKLTENGLRATSPREVFRLAARENLIEDPLIWFDFLEKRNQLSHVYREEYALQVETTFPSFRIHVQRLIDKLDTPKSMP
jgi:nucleotidyltransferase substrate binding protein (TIGR01987 family)